MIDPRSDMPPAETALPAVRAMYTRVLQSWASDVLALRRRSLDRPSCRGGVWSDQETQTGPWPFAAAASRRADAA
jgi:hypothetical protein